MPVLNIAAYRFAALAAPATWVEPLRQRCAADGLKGTVIVADEGVNLFLAGVVRAVDAWLDWARNDARFVDRDGLSVFADLSVKRSWSDTQPFGRLRVRHKPEIVTMRQAGVRPGAGRAPAIDPRTLAAWLAQGHDDRGRPVTLLDTRNAFEVAVGTFEGARHLDLTRFDQFPAAVDAWPAAARDETIVTFCTGGIRCEKAALYMRDAGFTDVLQLDGGILDYFAAVGDAGWRGDCFVFDERVALDAGLAATGGAVSADPPRHTTRRAPPP